MPKRGDGFDPTPHPTDPTPPTCDSQEDLLPHSSVPNLPQLREIPATLLQTQSNIHVSRFLDPNTTEQTHPTLTALSPPPSPRPSAFSEHSGSFYRTLTETSTDIIAHHEKSGIFAYCSPACNAILGYSPNELIGRDPRLLIHQEDLSFWQDAHAAACKGLRTASQPYRMQHKRGHWVWVESSCTPVFRSEKGTIESIVTVTRDISERKQTEAKLQQALKMESIGQLTGGIAHDFNNLLTVVISNLDLLEEMTEDPLHQKMIHQSREAALRGAELTSRLLSFARQQSLRPETTNVSALIHNLASILERTLGEDIRIQIQCQPGLWNANVDRTQLETALLNLALNARDAMPHGGNLLISATNCHRTQDSSPPAPLSPGHYIRIAVQDNGTGMTPKVQERAFDPFFTTKEVGKGSGLGLSMVYGFIKQSGGDIELDSALGQGTTLRLYLPKGPNTHAPITTHNTPVHYQGQGQRILVVEDQENVRKVVTEAIQRLGYNVLEATCSEEALHILQQHTDISLLFADIILPGGMNGIELSHHALALHPDLRLLFTSGFAEKAFTHELWPFRHVQLLKKPYRRSELGRSLHLALHPEHKHDA